MDSHRLLVFRQVAIDGSMAAAARTLGWTQPAVSQHVRRLERDLGAALVERVGRGVALTEAGRVLARHADRVAASLDAAEREIAELVSLQAGTVRLSAFRSAAATLVPLALANLARRHPGLEIRVNEAGPAQCELEVRSGQADAAVVFSYDQRSTYPGLHVQHLMTESVYVILPTGHPLVGQSSLAMPDLNAERWVAGCQFCRAHLIGAAADAGFSPNIRRSTDDYVVAQRMVSAALGVALLPARSLVSVHCIDVTAIPLRDCEFHVRVLTRPEALRVSAVRAILTALIDNSAQLAEVPGLRRC